MNHADHVRLIKNGVTTLNGVWADFGSGDGAFTLALADILRSKGQIYSIDKDAGRLDTQKKIFVSAFPKTDISFLNRDFTGPIPLPTLDGIIMANSLHYFRDKGTILTHHVLPYLKPDGTFILVEYNADRGNFWVPYPISYTSFIALCNTIHLSKPDYLHGVPSGFLDEIYAAKSTHTAPA